MKQSELKKNTGLNLTPGMYKIEDVLLAFPINKRKQKKEISS
jgi:hypothetical protein